MLLPLKGRTGRCVQEGQQPHNQVGCLSHRAEGGGPRADAREPPEHPDHATRDAAARLDVREPFQAAHQHSRDQPHRVLRHTEDLAINLYAETPDFVVNGPIQVCNNRLPDAARPSREKSDKHGDVATSQQYDSCHLLQMDLQRDIRHQ